MVARQRQSYHTPITSVLGCIAYLGNNEKICGPFRLPSNKFQNWPTFSVNSIMSSPTLRIINNLNCITNFIRIITVDWKASVRFPETPAWIINFIKLKKVLWIRPWIESGVKSAPGMRFWMAYKNPQRAWRKKSWGRGGWTPLQGCTNAQRRQACSWFDCFCHRVSQFFRVQWLQ